MESRQPTTSSSLQGVKRILGYALGRTASLFVTVAIAVYLTIMIANMGGYVDEIIRSLIDENISMMKKSGWLRGVPVDEQQKAIEDMRWQMEEAQGLHQPFALRSFRWLYNGMTLNLGESRIFVSLRYGNDSSLVKDIILDNLPNTLMLFATANILLFGASVFTALVLARKPGSFTDRLMTLLSPLSAAPSWFYGIVLIVIFAARLGWLPYGGMYSTDPAETERYGYALSTLRRMILPVGAIFLSAFFQSVYSWRTFFLIHSQEDYVDAARARGLPNRIVEGRYLLRPTLPSLLTNFALLLISAWSGSVLLELVFDWPGMGLAFFTSVLLMDTPVIVGFTVIYAYMLALTVFLLDITYAFVDPRVKLDFSPRLRLTTRDGLASRVRHFLRFNIPRPTLTNIRLDLPRLSDVLSNLRESSKSIARELIRYPSAIVGLVCIAFMLVLSVYVSLSITPESAIRIWRGQDYDWSENPQVAPPVWVNYFRKDPLPETIKLDSRDGDAQVQVMSTDESMTRSEMRFDVDYPYTGGFPQDLLIITTPQFTTKAPFVSMTLISPDGEETHLSTFTANGKTSYYLSQDKSLQRKLDTPLVTQALFGDGKTPRTGRYQVLVQVIQFEPDASLDVRVILTGQVYGWAGTDMRRRDLSLPLLWGLPTAMIFGFLAVTATTVATMFIAAMSTWYGGRVDALIQRLTEVNMILPLFPILVMVAAFYSRSIWLILGTTVLMSIFGTGIKTYRAAFLQFREMPYIEAAQAYGAGNFRVIFRYLVPRILPTLVPQMVVLFPGYVFIEASLALMGMGDPSLPTWGKILRDAYDNGALLRGYYHWALEPLAFLLFMSFGFSLLGFALDRVFNPRLREE